MNRYAISLLIVLALLLSPGCALMDAFSDTEEGDPDVGVPDADPNQVEPDADSDAGDDADPNQVEPDANQIEECVAGEERACDCEGLPEGVGVESCEDGFFGECVCPETCINFAGDEVYEGQPCDLCETTGYTCDEEGEAQCEDYIGGGFCGSCEEGPADLPECSSGETLYCDGDDQPQCGAQADDTTMVYVEEFSLNSADAVYVLFLEGKTAATGCSEGWELFGATEVPEAYGLVGEDDLFEGRFRTSLPEPGETPTGVLRVLIRQSVEGQGSSVTTHFACGPHTLENDEVTVSPYVNPYLFDGEY